MELHKQIHFTSLYNQDDEWVVDIEFEPEQSKAYVRFEPQGVLCNTDDWDALSQRVKDCINEMISKGE